MTAALEGDTLPLGPQTSLESVAGMKDHRWTIASTEWQIKGVRSARRPKRRWRDDIVGQQGAVWTRTVKDRER